MEAAAYSARGGAVIMDADQRDPPVLLINRGVAFCSTTLTDGRRAITDILLPGDFVGIENVVTGRSRHTANATQDLHYRALSCASVRGLMADPRIAMRVLSLVVRDRRRAVQHMIGLTRMDARERLSAFLLDIHDRLQHRKLISRPTFHIALTQDQIADHLGLTMVHVSRTLRRLREEKLVIVDRQIVIIVDLDGLRGVARGG
jgi:CRP-like cAMP-binding protein